MKLVMALELVLVQAMELVMALEWELLLVQVLAMKLM